MFGFAKFASLLILVVSVCNGAPALPGDGMTKRDGIPSTYRSTPIEPALQKRQGQNRNSNNNNNSYRPDQIKIDPPKYDPPKIEPPRIETPKNPKPPGGGNGMPKFP
ncbi:uncharacterized protein MELLADRAFT_110650 [Melampsora larici-populina 98AG31]|uniref:Secreted protein n=1 Tax=Melampsora larici-populina (strain 98AG31 / pathotype 3-4-7) TaxID=747676 RepID=F4S0H7_MELLP|nr:uncharacterized protein MELLADRAFT_110650 [Melampsora larici-populina 98AG31]EGG01770.1 secreted protein [Melampsora larici-populina 98AG31]